MLQYEEMSRLGSAHYTDSSDILVGIRDIGKALQDAGLSAKTTEMAQSLTEVASPSRGHLGPKVD